VPELIVIVGPIASGKSTIAYELGSRFRAADRSVAVLDPDDVVDTIGGFAGLTPARFRQAQLVYGELIAAWLRRRFDVIAHGPSSTTRKMRHSSTRCRPKSLRDACSSWPPTR
jgi:hypothetical protein